MRFLRQGPVLATAGLALAAQLAIGCSGADGAGGDGDAIGQQGSEPAFPERTADAVVVASGRDGSTTWELVAQDSVEGPCLGLRVDGVDGTEGCGFEVPERHDVAFFVADDGGGSTFVAGAVAPGAAGVRLELEGAPPVEAEPVGTDAGLASDFFVAPLPAGSRLEAVVALGDGGAVLERREAAGTDDGTDPAG